MAERKITTRIEITGESEYKQAIKDLNASLKLYNSELSNLKEKNKDAQNSYVEQYTVFTLSVNYSACSCRFSLL